MRDGWLNGMECFGMSAWIYGMDCSRMGGSMDGAAPVMQIAHEECGNVLLWWPTTRAIESLLGERNNLHRRNMSNCKTNLL